MIVDHKYVLNCGTVSDINEHLPTLCEYSKQCNTVAEFGVRSVVSTWAFLKGLKDGIPGKKKLVCVDLKKSPNIVEAEQAARLAGIEMQFIEENDLKVDLQEGVDMLFIDTWHVYGQLKRELEKHAHNVRKYIAMHDTEIDGVFGETIRMQNLGLAWDPYVQSLESGIPESEIKRGLSPAISEFLSNGDSKGGKWEIAQHFTNNNGLTILKRVS